MKKIFVVLMLLVMTVTLAGCGKDKDKVDEYTAENPLVLNFGYVVGTDDAAHLAAVDFKEAIEEESEGRVEVKLYANGELGDDTAVLEAILLGDVQITSCATSPMSGYDAKLTLTELPYLYDDFDSMDEAMTGDVYELVKPWYADVGFELFGFNYDGTRELSNNVRPIYTLDDCKGLKLRAMDSPSHIATLECLGANAIPMGYGDIYTGLQQGTVDGQDNPPALTYTSKFNEVLKYFSLTDMIMSNSPVVMSKKIFDGYPEDIQEMIRKHLVATQVTWQRGAQREAELDYIKKIDESGCEVNEIEDMEEFKKAMDPVYEKAKEDYGEEVYNEFLKAANHK